jgi:RNA polymerase sigma factor (sigma-70 family)
VGRAFSETTDPSDSPSDAVLIDGVRRGDMAAFGMLYERHVIVARRAAASFAATGAERDDLVAEAFARMLRILRSGQGPAEKFRPYLLRTMRNAMIDWRRRDAAMSLYADVPENSAAAGAGENDDPVGRRMHAAVAAEAFASLPERWRIVLWHTKIEGESPAQIAPQLGMTPNGVAALAYRAREGLRQAYLDQHLPTVDTIERGACRTVVDQLAGWVRHGLTARKMHWITTHLNHCADCRDLATDLDRLNHELPATMAPLLFGAPFAAAHLASTANAVTASSGATGSVAGTVASSGTILASTGLSGASLSTVSVPAVSWLTSAKAVVAGAAIVTTTAVSSIGSDPAPLPGNGAAIVAAAPPIHTPALGPGASSTARPDYVDLTSSPANPTPPGPAAAKTARQTTKHTTKQKPERPTSKKKVRQTAKQSKKTSKATKKEAKLAKKATKKGSKKTSSSQSGV